VTWDYLPGQITEGSGPWRALAGYAGATPAEMDAYVRANRDDLYDLLAGRTKLPAPPGFSQWADTPSYNAP
jgi:hypothetical protein